MQHSLGQGQEKIIVRVKGWMVLLSQTCHETVPSSRGFTLAMLARRLKQRPLARQPSLTASPSPPPP